MSDKTSFYVNRREFLLYLVDRTKNCVEGSGPSRRISYNDSLVRTSTIGDIEPKIQISLVYNADFKSEMLESVKTGIRHVTVSRNSATAVSAALFFPADIPLVTTETITGLIQKWETAKETMSAGFAIPVYKGRNGHPLLIPEKYFDEILDYNGNGGLKTIRNRYLSYMVKYNTEDEGCILDMDTPDDYKRLLEYDRQQRL